MNRTVKTLAAAILIVAVTSAAGGTETLSASAFKPIQTVDGSSHFEDLRFCFDDCPWPASQFGGSGAFVVR